ncbi:hypothetical protein K458DRAFT_479285 [Lentithecium fluviatile CBS 122367]|uniref:Microbial-type PARG catalytic domain-containing protein n=1 Tax=Lentithecium fluviatile CBS 122367 TaxID=1168545 RepID=A0A6G1IU24_9PLEO|nr:hypothetical protein K458DRAFT_479285 [Lentithecium fluviatile CBS 122367]
MGRTDKSQGLAPRSIRKDLRAKQARHIVNKVIPAILASNARARIGADGSELIIDPRSSTAISKENGNEAVDGEDARYVKRKGQGRRKAKGAGFDDGEEVIVKAGHEKDRKSKRSGKKRNDSLDEGISQLSLQTPPSQDLPERSIRIINTDTLTAAQILKYSSKPSCKDLNPCILNMASPLRPGGGVLTGATSQEEFLCARTTLLPSLKESFYRLPEYGGVFTHDVLVFHNAQAISSPTDELIPVERYYVDVISAGMLRFPELEGAEDEPKSLSKKDKVIVERKMRAVLRIASSRGVKQLVLGAWGCGAYGNPVRNIAEAWRNTLFGEATDGKKGKTTEPQETWRPITDIVFAISNVKMAKDFAQTFGHGVEVEARPDGPAEDDEEESDAVAEELRTKIKEMEGQLGSVWNADLKQRMGVILDGLRAQLKKREGGTASEEDEDTNEGIAKSTNGEKVGGSEEADESDEGHEENEDEDEETNDDTELSDDGNQDSGLKLPSTR